MSARAPAKKRRRKPNDSLRKRIQERKGERAAADVLRDTARSMEDVRRQREQQDIIIIDDSSDSDGPGPSSLPGYDPPSPDLDSPPFVPSNPPKPSMPSPVGSAPRGVLILGKQVGAGAFGSVVNSIYYDPDAPKSKIINYVGEPLQPRKHYAVKIQDKDETKHEMKILRKLGESPYIMKVYGRGDVPGETKMDAMVSDMYTQTLDNRTRKESIETRRRNFHKLTQQMFEAVAVMASKNIIHRDLHAGNIMFGSNPYGEPKIIDFGWSAEAPPNGLFIPFPGMPDSEPYRIFHPPEQRMLLDGIYQYGPCSTKFDVWSMAVNLIELVYDSSKNRAVHWSGTMPRDFDLLMRCTILGIHPRSEIANSYTSLDSLDRARRRGGGKTYPDAARMVECSYMESETVDNICSYFEEKMGEVRLVLSMPTQLGEVLHDCLALEASRPTAASVVQRLQGPSLSSAVASSSAFLKLRF